MHLLDENTLALVEGKGTKVLDTRYIVSIREGIEWTRHSFAVRLWFGSHTLFLLILR